MFWGTIPVTVTKMQHEKCASQFAIDKKWSNGMSVKYFEIKLGFARKLKRLKKWRTQNRKCFYCHTKLSFDMSTYDHIIPQCEGGSEHYDNFVVACKKCNNVRKDMPFELFCNIITCEEDRIDFEREKNRFNQKEKEKRLKVKKEKNKLENKKDADERIKLHLEIMDISKKIKRCKELINILKKKKEDMDKLSVLDNNNKRVYLVITKRNKILHKIQNKLTNDRTKLMKQQKIIKNKGG